MIQKEIKTMKIGEIKRFYNNNQKELQITKQRVSTDEGDIIGYLAEIFSKSFGKIKERIFYNFNSKYPKQLEKIFLNNEI